MLPENLEKIFCALNAAEARYLVVGGMAVMAHGFVRMTRALDLVVALDGANPKRVLKALGSLGYRPKVHVALMDFANPEKRAEWVAEKGMQVFQVVSDDLMDCPVDLFVEEPIPFAEMYAGRKEFSFSDGLSIPVVGLPQLKRLKAIAGRPRDLLDLEELSRIENDHE